MSKPDRTTLTIAAGAVASTAFEHRGSIIDSFHFPSAITGTKLTVQVSNDGTVWTSLLDVEGNESADYSAATNANKSRALPVKCRAFWYMRFLSDAAGPGYEAAERSIVVLSRP